MTGEGRVRRIYLLFGVFMVVALLIGSRRPSALVACTVLMAAVGLYVVICGGGAWRRGVRHPASAAPFRVVGLAIVAAGMGIPAAFLLRALSAPSQGCTW